MAYETLLVEKEENIVLVTLNRPDKLNALNRTMGYELRRLFQELGGDPETRAVIFTGAGRAFCAGGDIQDIMVDLAPAGIGEKEEALRLFDLVAWELVNLEKPTIAAINGVAVGGGCCLALACDIRIASTQARMGLVFVRRGLSAADMGATWLLPRIVGAGWAAQLLFTGDIIEAELARSIGLVNELLSPEELLPRAKELARKLAAGPPLALKMTKRALNRSLHRGMAEHLDFEAAVQTYCFYTEDHQEGVRSFVEKREPQFKGK